MLQLLQWLEKQPGLAALGALVLVFFVLAPLVLRLAGLTGTQIVTVIKLTFQFFVNLAAGLRDENKNGK